MDTFDCDRRRRARNLRAKYRRWTMEGRHLDEWNLWNQLFREMTETLPQDLIAISRLQPERSEDRLIDAALQSKLQDVDSGNWVHWKPLVVEGARKNYPVFVVDGNHRAQALLQSGMSGFACCVFASSKIISVVGQPRQRKPSQPHSGSTKHWAQTVGSTQSEIVAAKLFKTLRSVRRAPSRRPFRAFLYRKHERPSVPERRQSRCPQGGVRPLLSGTLT